MKGAEKVSVPFSMNGTEVDLPLPKYHGLILLLHMQHHMLSEGIGLRHLLDYCLFVDRTSQDDFWQTDLLPILKKIGLYKYAQVMAKTGTLYFNTRCPSWAEEAESDLCDAVMQDILIGGNFGRKNMTRSLSGRMISQHGKEGTRHGSVYNLWHTLNHAVALKHPIVHKIPPLYLIYDTGIAFRWCYRVMTGKRRSMIGSSKYVAERKSVYAQLKIFEIEKGL